jgi:hypothetical protein
VKAAKILDYSMARMKPKAVVVSKIAGSLNNIHENEPRFEMI